MKNQSKTRTKVVPVPHGDVKRVAKLFNITENTVRRRFQRRDKQIVQALVDLQRQRNAEQEEVEQMVQLLSGNHQ